MMTNYKQLELFTDFSIKQIEKGNAKTESIGIFSPYNRFSMSLCENVNFTSNCQMPIVAGCTLAPPRIFVAFIGLGIRAQRIIFHTSTRQTTGFCHF